MSAERPASEPVYLQVMTSVASRQDATRIAEVALAERLAACVQILGPMTSIYRWQGEIETAEEFLCLLKTRAEHYPALETAIRRAHPYLVPEILAVPVLAGHRGYLDWLDGEVGATRGSV